MTNVPPGVLRRIQEVVGPKGYITDPIEMAPHLKEERGLYVGRAAMVVRPASTAELAQVVAICDHARVPIVPQGGNTGLVGGQVPFEHGREIVVCLSRLNRIRALDPINFTMTVEAGCILESVQEAASEIGCFFPLSLAAEGSCQIGGNLATNAGGTAVLRYGNARELVLGLEVVLADGRVWEGLRALRKDNTGYDLKQVFMGSEGTLGIITAAVLKLFPHPRDVQTAFVAARDPAAVVELLARTRAASGDAVSAFELIPRLGLDFVLRHIPGTSDPLPGTRCPYYVLIELSSSQDLGEEFGLRATLERVLSTALEDGLVVDAALAESTQQGYQLWQLRETLPEAQKYEGGSIKHDVSVPVSRVPEFLEQATLAVQAAMPGIRPCPFGHVGDGNIHFNLSQPLGMDKEAYLAQWGRLNRVVHDIAASLGGSISAEHGIGRLKREELVHYKSEVEMDLMRKLKAAFDPHGTLNPGKVV